MEGEGSVAEDGDEVLAGIGGEGDEAAEDRKETGVGSDLEVRVVGAVRSFEVTHNSSP